MVDWQKLHALRAKYGVSPCFKEQSFWLLPSFLNIALQ
jgi:hypothetical protein